MAASDHKPDPQSWKNFNRKRHDPDHITNCKAAKHGYLANGKNQVHHILCISSVADSNLPPNKKSYIRACMKETTWDINDAHNNIGLPLKIAYLQYERAKNKAKADKGWDGYPCHQNDHGPYITDVIAYLKKAIWNKLKVAKKKKKCKTVKGKAIEQDLKDGSDFWRDFLTDRGSGADGMGSGNGTLYCWDHRNDAGIVKVWYVPFSMAKAALGYPRKPPPSTLPPKTKDALKSLFRGL